MIRAIGSFLRNLFPGNVGMALGRFLRVIGGAALAAGITAAISTVGTLPVSDPYVLATITAALVAADKWFRSNGIY